MIANARMYSVSPDVAALWRALLSAIIAQSGLTMELVEHAEPKPLDELWQRPDQGAVFMCGLPFSRAEPQPVLVAAPVPSPAEFGGRACYWSDLVVRTDSPYRTLADTFGGRLALTVPGSQSGCVAALSHFMAVPARAGGEPLFSEIVAPTVTPLGALRAVIEGAADIAPIDAYALRLMQRHRAPLASRVRVIDRTVATPIPPLVGAAAPAALQQAFLEAHRNAHIQALMNPLLLQGFVAPESSSYRVLKDRYQAAVSFWHTHRLATVTHTAFAL